MNEASKDQLIGELKAMRVQPGEVLVIQSDCALNPEQRASLRDAIASSGIRAVVLERGLKATAVQSDGVPG